MPSPHDVERHRIQKERQKANKKAANEKKEEEWLRFGALESMREAMSLQRAEAQIQAEAKARQERERTEREKFEREFREEERRRELEQRRKHLQSMAQDPLAQRRERYVNLGLTIRKKKDQVTCSITVMV
ncbi:hypothetical protein QAD02_023119 [Eretmocerus hayati]|uniref:Uncharacterized protein n=1 Tax=Eretmocerus hayati TaxID=131215 RepID=A0ACC2PUQ4_9HYME|nr:hypothetical protein QAD02_023119 [Eretmocerus hayati]